MVRGIAVSLALLASGCLAVNPSFDIDASADASGTTHIALPPAVTTTDAPIDATTSDATDGAATTDLAVATSTGDTTDAPAPETTTLETTLATTTGDATTDADPVVDVPACDPADASLIACYDFEPDLAEPTHLLDGSQYGNHGLRHGFGAVPGISGDAVQVLPNAQLSVPDSVSLDATAALSLAAWVWLPAAPAPGQRVGVIDKDGQWGLFIRDTGPICITAGLSVAADVQLPAGAWAHLACIFDGHTLILHIDGQPVVSAVQSGTVAASDQPMMLGSNSPDYSEPMIGGRLDNVRVWNAALTPAALCTQAGACSD